MVHFDGRLKMNRAGWILALWSMIGLTVYPGKLVAQENERLLEDDVFESNLPAARHLADQALLANPVPETLAPEARSRAYMERAAAARRLEQYEQERLFYEQALAYAGRNAEAAFTVYSTGLVPYYCTRGEWLNCRQMREQGLLLGPEGGRRLSQLVMLSELSARMHDFPAAQRYLQQGRSYLDGHLRMKARAWRVHGDMWQAMVAFASAALAHHSGKMKEAEGSYRVCLQFLLSAVIAGAEREKVLFWQSHCTDRLLSVLMAQGKLQESESLMFDVRALNDALAETHQNSAFKLKSLVPSVRLLLESGRFRPAREELLRGIDTLKKFGAMESSALLATLRGQMAFLSMIEGRWGEADQWYQARRLGLESNSEMARQAGIYSPEWSYTLLRLGRVDEALQMQQGISKRRSKLYDQDSLFFWESQAFLGLAQAAKGQKEAAFSTLSQAVPKMLALANDEQTTSDGGIARTIRMNWIMDGYLNLLADFALAGQHPGNIDPRSEAFRLADIARGSVVQQALQSAAARSAIDNPELAALVMQGQDVQQEIGMIVDSLSSLLSRGRLQSNDKLVTDLRSRMKNLREKHAEILKRVGEGFPEFAALLDAKPLGIAQLRKFLKPGESLLAFYSGHNSTLIWAIPQQGEAVLARAPLGQAELQQYVTSLRRSLDPEGGSGADMAEYDFVRAHDLFQKLLAPVSAGFSSATDLIIVPHGPLGQLPFGVITTTPFQPQTGTLQFGSYAQAPWLLKQASIVQLPSALALAALRLRDNKQVAGRSFIGFGNPTFMPDTEAGTPARMRGGMLRRDLALRPEPAATATPSVSTAGQISLRMFSYIPALPDTAEEITEIARIVHANPAEDLFLGPRASEKNVKQTPLNRYRIVMFATHGLKAGDLRGLNEPALALSNPQITGEQEDGFLTLSEILSLKMNADWVVLSACNTASPDGKAQEAVSGLGRAFFYAGARALLVSNWPVETESARFLTTRLFQKQAENPNLNRAQALRQAALELMQGSYKDASGKAQFSFAHPMFWAPFSLVGDAGGK